MKWKKDMRGLDKTKENTKISYMWILTYFSLSPLEYLLASNGMFGLLNFPSLAKAKDPFSLKKGVTIREPRNRVETSKYFIALSYRRHEVDRSERKGCHKPRI